MSFAGAHRFDSVESIAVIGMACCLPGASDVEALWRLLSAGDCSIEPIPKTRWDSDALYHPERKTPGRTVNRQAGLIDDIYGFDAGLFGISQREARAMDPQQRMLLEQTWRALEDAGLTQAVLSGQRVGVYAASMANDYQQNATSPFKAPDAYSALGVYSAFLANRLSSFFGFRGESVTLDSACASSLAALHQARLALLNDSLDYCIVAAANAILNPWKSVSFSQAGMLSESGLCKAFSDDAHGYAPGEGAVVLVLQRTSDAKASRIHGLILGSAINHMGQTASITAPSVEAEVEVIQAALKRAGVDAEKISYVECHGTGTAIGDPIEIEALARVLPQRRKDSERPRALIGSIKSNIGHLEAASGLAGVLKVLLMMRHGQIPETLHLERDNPLIDFDALSFEPARHRLEWLDRPRIAGVSSFGFGGAGGHAILAEPPVFKSEKIDSAEAVALSFSAADEASLRNLAQAYAELLESPDAPDLATLARAMSLQRSGLRHRVLLIVRSIDEAIACLKSPDLPIRSQGLPSLAIRLLPGIDLQALQHLPGLKRLSLEKKLKVSGLSFDFEPVRSFSLARALMRLLEECGLEADTVQALGDSRWVALAGLGVLRDDAAAFAALYGRFENIKVQRPSALYCDGDRFITPLAPSEAFIESLFEESELDALLELGRRLWLCNHSFRAQFEEWSGLIGASAENLLQDEGLSLVACLAIAASICSISTRWSLRLPGTVKAWPAWPIAAMASDGLIPKSLALELLKGEQPASSLIESLAKIRRAPRVGLHPWLDAQRGLCPEFLSFDFLSEAQSLPEPEEAVLFVIGPEFNETLSCQCVHFDPAQGLQGFELALAKLWHLGFDIKPHVLGLSAPHIDLPLYPFNRQAYELSRFPEDGSFKLWETGQVLAHETKPFEASKPVMAEIAFDWIECLKLCVAETLEADVSEIDIEKPLDHQGIDSLISMDLIARIEHHTAVRLNPGLIESLRSVKALAERLSAQSPAPLIAEAEYSTQTSEPVLAETAQRLSIGASGLLDTLRWVDMALPEPQAGEVQVEVSASGLNFRDLMIALNALPEASGDPLGLEFCGVIKALGSDVKGFSLNQRVFGLAKGAMSKRLNTAACLIAPVSSRLSDAEAAALPIVYITAIRCLEQLSGSQAGAWEPGGAFPHPEEGDGGPRQSILIHAAAGGLGQAAIQLAKLWGFKIYATAGSPEKRLWLESQGLEGVMDSRSLAFADEIMKATLGRGVDYVLNSLTGDAIDRGIDCLASGGLFIEVGKTDIRSPESVAARRADVRYLVYDLIAELIDAPERIGDVLQSLAHRIESFELKPLPVETFQFTEALAAFQHMARARHKGKIVLCDSSIQSLKSFGQAVIGLSGRFPGASDCDALWNRLESGLSAIGEVPSGRWSEEEIAGFAGQDRVSILRGGFLQEAEHFDHGLFGFSPREARATDPRQRLLLEEVWKALKDAGYEWNRPEDCLKDSGMGVFIACDAGDYGFKRVLNRTPEDQLALAGNLPSSLAARLSHVFGLQGPAMTLDSACSSSLAALWAAERALQRGDCSTAIVAAVSLHATPYLAGQLAASGFLSKQGQCKPYAQDADGFVPAEACVALVLKPYDRAVADGDRLHAVLKSVGVGHDGSSKSFTHPNFESQAALQADCLSQAGLTPEQIDLISAHGVGLPSGDAAEIKALALTFQGLEARLPLTTLKPRLGHTLAAAGLCAMTHAILQMQRKRFLPVGIQDQAMIPEWDRSGFYMPSQSTAWEKPFDAGPRRVLLNAFSINGCNGVAILEEAPFERSVGFKSGPLKSRRFWIDSDPELRTVKFSENEIPCRGEFIRLGRLKPPLQTRKLEREAYSSEIVAPDFEAQLREELAVLLQEEAQSLDLDLAPAMLGLESILAIEFQHRLKRRFGVELGLDAILGLASVRDLLAFLNAGVRSDEPDPEASMDESPDEPFHLTDLQAAYWSGRNPELPLGGVDCQVYWEFELTPSLSGSHQEKLEAAWNRLIATHPMLRAVIDADGRQRILPSVPHYSLPFHDLSGLSFDEAEVRRDALSEAMRLEAIDPGRWPLFRMALSRTDSGLRLHCGLNLMVMDVLSLYSLLDQWAILASQPETPMETPSIGFKQCVERMKAEPHRKSERFWAERAPLLPPSPQLPLIKPLEHAGRLKTQRLQALIALDDWKKIAQAAQQRGLSQSVTVLTAFSQALAHWTLDSYFTLNLTTHTRPAIHPDINRVIGNFTGTVLLDVDVGKGSAFQDLASIIAKRLIEHLSHADYSCIPLLRQRAMSQGFASSVMPVVFTSMLGYQALRGHAHTLIGRLVQGSTQTPQVTIDAQVQEDEQGLILSWDYALGVFAEGLPEAIFSAWIETLKSLVQESAWELDLGALIEAREASVREASNSAVMDVSDEALFEPFLKQAEAHPDRIAIIADDRILTYGELAELCQGLAGQLLELGLKPGELVAIALPRGWRQVMAAIAVQMAGGAYLPLAYDLPESRFKHLAERGEVRIGLGDRGLAWPEGVKTLTLALALSQGERVQAASTLGVRDAAESLSSLSLRERGGVRGEGDNLAYVIFTSGSTGEPKGVMLSHKAALNTCLDINHRFRLVPEDRVLALSALNFDLSVWDIFGTLAQGAAIVIPRPESANDPAYLARLIHEHRVSIWNSVPMYCELFLAGEPDAAEIASLRLVMLSGDWIALGLAERLRQRVPDIQVHSLGGATEAAIWSIHHPIDAKPRGGWVSVPYGKALANQSMQVLDDRMKPCPDCVTGDLYIGGIGLAMGYWRDTERTEASFIHHPESGERLYKTGDRARWREEGLIEFMGRRDGQVKIDGFRVELGEIEALLRLQPQVREAVAVAPADEKGRRRLAAFCLTDGDIDAQSLLDALRHSLPGYMIPKELRILDSFPLTDNEKVDRHRLSETAFKPLEVQTPQKPCDLNELEKRLIDLWADILSESTGISRRPDAQTNLFELGADSLSAVIAARRISNELNIPCSVTDLFEHASIARLAKALSAHAPEPAPLISRKSSVDRRSQFRSSLDE